MRIAFISTNNQTPWGGSEELWSKALIQLKQDGHSVAASVAEWDPKPEAIQYLLDLDVHIFHHLRCDTLRRRVLRRIVSSITTSGTVVWQPDYFLILKSFKPDLVVISQGSLEQAHAAMEACLNRSIPFITLTQLVGEYHAISDSMASKLHRLFEQAIANFFLSTANIELASRLLGYSIPKAHITFNPYKQPLVNEIPPFPTLDSGLDLACVAALTMVHKGQDNILEILARPKWKDRNIRVHFYGKGSNEQILKRLSARWNLANVYFHGFTSDIASIWKECHALFLASHMEGSPIVMLEAMMFQRPVIAPPVGSTTDFIKNYHNGLLAISPEIHHLEQALENAWVMRERLQEMGANAYRMVMEVVPPHPEKDFAKALVDLIEKRFLNFQ